MRDYAKISPQFWITTAKQIKNQGLGFEAAYIALYLQSCPNSNMIGVYYLPVMLIAHQSGLTLEGATKTLQRLCQIGFCTYDEEMEYVWVHDMAFEQVGGQLKQTDNRVKSINDDYQSLPNLSFLQEFFDKYHTLFFLENRRKNRISLQDPSKPLLSQEQKQDQEQEQKNIFMSGKPDIANLNVENTFSNTSSNTLKNQALEILKFLNEKTGRAYRPVDTNLKLIIARLKSGATVIDCRQIIAKKTREWKSDPKMAEYLRPATLFNATKFEQYVGELVLPVENSTP